MKEVLIIGAGQLGERSIQSLLHKNSKYKISFYEKNIERSDFIKNTYNVNQINSIDNLVRYDVIHVATTSKGRHEILKNNTIKKNCLVLVEKPTASNINELKDQASWTNKQNYLVNLNRRYFPVNQKIQEILKGPFTLECFAKDLHIFGNISHFLDLMRFFGVKSEYSIRLDDAFKIFDTKRSGYKDIRGKLILEYECGSKLSLIDDSEVNQQGYIYKYTYNNKVFSYNELERKILDNNLLDDSISPTTDLLKYHSELFEIVTKDFESNMCLLPNIYNVSNDNISAYKKIHEVFDISPDKILPIS